MDASGNPPEDARRQAEISEIVRIQLALMKQTGEGQRGQHYKQQACLQARFEVLQDIPEMCRVGLFARPATYNAWLRLSNGRQADDTHSDVHGLAIKLLGVPGMKILETEAVATTHDFILADNPVFIIRDTSEYLRFMKEFDGGQPVLGIPFAFIGWLLLNHPQDIPVLMSFDKHLHDSPLVAQYYSQTPYQLGAGASTIVRYGLTPQPGNIIEPIPKAWRDASYLRRAMVDHLTTAGREAVFDFTMQLYENAPPEAIDNPTVSWNAPVHTVARITIPAQAFDTTARADYGEQLSFTPWHALPEHRPAGQINWIRRAVYIASSGLRHDATDKPRIEPEGAEFAVP